MTPGPPSATGSSESTTRLLSRIRATLEALRDDPVRFQTEILGRTLWSKQVEICHAVARSPITLIPAGRAVGKSYLLAGLVLWWVYTRPRSLVVVTAPDHRQVASVLMAELRRAVLTCPVPLGHVHMTEGYASPQRLDVTHGEKWSVLGFAAKHEEGFSGQHAAELLVIVDEASGITEPIWSAIHGLAAKRLVASGNPIRYDCRFRELHELAVEGSETITTVPISSLEHPDAALEHSPVGAVSASYLAQMREIHGESSPWWRSNILGLFPTEESVRFLPTAWLDACNREGVTSDPAWTQCAPGAACIGVDVGGGVGADRSVVLVRNRIQILAIFASEWHGVLDDARHRLEPVVLALAKKWQVPPERVIYDKGGPGRNLDSYLAKWAEREQEEWRLAHASDIIPPRPDEGPWPNGFSGAVGHFGAGKGGKLYVNRRTANAFALKRRLDPHRKGYVPLYAGGLEHWPALRQELLALHAPVMEVEEGEVKERLEDKPALRHRLKRSPDLLDALLMTFAFE